ncbi:MAG TPA: hypothetical protein VEU30_13315 [Thermoanaerobaculia bacterium]|nr:hypothetical protein [Thermoanaerobaculia bacterium]
MNGDEIVSFPQRGGEASHLTYEEMEAWLDGRADRIDRELAQGHLALCPRCAAELDDLGKVRESLAPKRRWWIAAAAAALGAILSMTFLARSPEPEPLLTATQPLPPEVRPTPPQSKPAETVRTLTKPAILATLAGAPRTLRGTSEWAKLQLKAPVATVVLDARPRFRWMVANGANGAAEYTVAVADHETSADAASGSTTETWWRPGEPLARGRTYTWQVTVQSRDGRWTVPQPSDAEALFFVASPATVKKIEAVPAERHLERGIALAEHGILDDAERELEQAIKEGSEEAGALLEEVQSWRAQPARPTATKGAQ